MTHFKIFERNKKLMSKRVKFIVLNQQLCRVEKINYHFALVQRQNRILNKIN